MGSDFRIWLGSGAEVQQGLRLLNHYAPNPHLERLVKLNPTRYKSLLIKSLSRICGTPPPELPSKESTDKTYPKFRENWPFLRETQCPMELKVLASEKITAYHNYVEAHQRLFDCTSLDMCLETARTVIENYVENRKIYSEFAYYSENHSVLGKHPIFKEMQDRAELLHLTVKDLFRKKTNLQKAIWRLAKQIESGDKPHLIIDRKHRLEQHKRDLAEIENIVNNYER